MRITMMQIIEYSQADHADRTSYCKYNGKNRQNFLPV
jgi:hypothetical protein